MYSSHLPFRIGFMSAAVTAVVTMLAGCNVEGADQRPPSAPEIPVARPELRSIAPSHHFPGRVEAINRVELRPRVSGYIEAVLFEEGALVQKGQLLYRIDARPYRARLAEADAALALATAELKLAQQEQARAKRLVEHNAIAVQELDRREAALSAARARLAVAEAARKLSALELTYADIHAPITGRVGRALATVGNLVSADSSGGSLLTVLVSTDPVFVTFDIDEMTAAQAGANGERLKPVRFSVAGQSTEATGTVTFLDNEMGKGTGTLRLRAQLQNPDGRLMPGMLGRVTLTLDQTHETLLIDDKAIGTDQGHRYVLVAGEDGKLAYRLVDTGAQHGALRAINSGLAPDDLVVVNGLMRVRPGAVIQPVPVSMERAAAGDYTPIRSSVASAE
jgi:membrane fusion protein, multidrug efflux system